jgi:hypothetical protein
MEATKTISTGTIRVQNVLVSNPTNNAAEIVFTDTDGTNILNITAAAQDSMDFGGLWIADNGLKVDGTIADANVVVTVLHSQDGA